MLIAEHGAAGRQRLRATAAWRDNRTTVIGMDQLDIAAAGQLNGLVAQHVAVVRADVKEAAVAIRLADEVVGILCQCTVARLALAQPFLDAQPADRRGNRARRSTQYGDLLIRPPAARLAGVKPDEAVPIATDPQGQRNHPAHPVSEKEGALGF